MLRIPRNEILMRKLSADTGDRRLLRLRELFDEFDSLDDANDVISTTELSRAVREVLPVDDYANVDLTRMIMIADMDKSGDVDFSEFVALFGGVADADLSLESLARFWVMQAEATPHDKRRNKLRQLFEEFDMTDTRDGAISGLELSRMLREKLPSKDYATADINRMMRLADADSSGFIEFDEFCILYGSLPDDELTLEACAEFWLGASMASGGEDWD